MNTPISPRRPTRPLVPEDIARPRASDSFVRACFATAQSRALQRDVAEFLADDRVAAGFVGRAAVTPGSTTAIGWSALVQAEFGAFLASLAPYGATPRLVAQAQQVEPRPVAVNHPVRLTGPAGAAFVTELDAIPIATSTFGLIEVPASKKLASIIPWSRELSRRTNAEAIFRALLSEDLGANLDSALLSTAAASASTPAGLLNGVAPITALPGGDRAAAEADLAALGSAVADGGSGSITYILTPASLARLRVLAPEIAGSLDLVSSAAVPAGRVVAVDARSLLIGISVPEILLGDEVLLHMDTTPGPIVDGATSNPVRSTWQTASVAVRLLCDVAWAKRRATAIAFVDNASW